MKKTHCIRTHLTHVFCDGWIDTCAVLAGLYFCFLSFGYLTWHRAYLAFTLTFLGVLPGDRGWDKTWYLGTLGWVGSGIVTSASAACCFYHPGILVPVLWILIRFRLHSFYPDCLFKCRELYYSLVLFSLYAMENKPPQACDRRNWALIRGLRSVHVGLC